MPLAVVVGAANIHDSAAFEDLVDAVAPTEADRTYDPKSTRWQQEGGVAYRAAGRSQLPRIAFSKVSNAVMKPATDSLDSLALGDSTSRPP